MEKLYTYSNIRLVFPLFFCYNFYGIIRPFFKKKRLCTKIKKGADPLYSIADVWKLVIEQLKKDLSETTINTWFDEIEVIEIKDNTFVLHCKNAFKKGYIESLFLKNLKSALKDIFSSDFEVKILDDRDMVSYGTSPESKRGTTLLESGKFTFENFVVGSSNKIAYAAAQSVAEAPAERYNPLFIYGDSGLGKTHLIYAIAHEFRKNNPSMKVVYIKGDEFTNELIQSIREGKNQEFRDKYRQADLLLMDDIQFIAGKDTTQEEFFHTFNNLYESSKQIVLTSDRPPKEMAKLEDRLRTRFEWGLMVDVTAPDFETRLAIVKNKAAAKGIRLSEEIYQYIAENVTANVRQIEGTLNKAAAYQELQGVDMDQESIDRAIRDMLKKDNEYVPQPDDIIEYVCSYFKVEDSVIRGKTKTAEVANARQIAMFLIRRMTNLPTTTIGKFFGDRDHTTVMHSLDKVEKTMKADSDFASMIKEITTNINSKK